MHYSKRMMKDDEDDKTHKPILDLHLTRPIWPKQPQLHN